mgnify:CR=1 FL=1
MKTFDVYDFAAQDKAYLWTHENEKIVLVFPNGEENTCYWRQAVLSIPCWKVFRSYDWLHDTLTPDFILKFPLNKSSLENMFNKVLSHMRQFRERKTVSERELSRLIFVEFNKLHNDVIRYLTPYVSASGARELREIIHHPEMEKIFDDVSNHRISIQKAYKLQDTLVRTHIDFRDNCMARDVRYNIVDSKQFNQVAMVRGICTDIDNIQFKDAVMTSYGRGMHNILWSAQESRGASIAAIQAKDPVSSSDYLNRRLQIMSGVYDKVFPGDCGTKTTVPWNIDSKDDLKSALGCYIEEDGLFRPITSRDDALVGTIVRLRTASYCHHLHEYGVCEVCMGQVSDNIPEDFAIGHLSIIGALGDFVQKSLSAKHLIVSREVEAFSLNETTAKYLRFPRRDDTDELVLQTKLLNNPRWKKVELIFDSRDLPFLADLEAGVAPEDIQVSSLAIGSCAISLSDKAKERIMEELLVSDHSRKARLTREFVLYVANNREVIDTTRSNRISIELQYGKWDLKDPVFSIPHKISSVEDFMRSFESIIKSAGKHGIDANNPVGVSDMMRLCYDVVMSVVGIPVSHLGVMIASLLVRDAKNMDYRPPLPDGNREFETMGNIFGHRSLSQLLAYEKRPGYFKSPVLTLNRLRPNHPFDVLYYPGAADIYHDVRLALERGDYTEDYMPVEKPTHHLAE